MQTHTEWIDARTKKDRKASDQSNGHHYTLDWFNERTGITLTEYIHFYLLESNSISRARLIRLGSNSIRVDKTEYTMID